MPGTGLSQQKTEQQTRHWSCILLQDLTLGRGGLRPVLSSYRGPEFYWFGQVTQKPKPQSVFSAPPVEVAFPPPYAPVRPMVMFWRKNSSPSWDEEGSFSLLPRAPFLRHMWSRFGYGGSGRNFPGAEEVLSSF